MRFLPHLRRIVLAAPALLVAGAAPAQEPPAGGEGAAPPAQEDDLPGTPEGAAREAMWYAPTAEDWAKPVLLHWERTWDDALAVAKRTNKPILVCVNMDGEIASEHYAGVRYRQPEVARLYEPYVCVVASVYRHNPRDYDDQGRRIECPRFHGVTCGEHIAIEPIVYEQFLDQRRVAPRHIMVELDGSEVYDVYYAFDTKSVFRSIRRGIVEREIRPNPDAPEDVALIDRVASPAAADRYVVEQAYIKGDREVRQKLLARALETDGAAPIDLLRLAIFGLDVELSRMAREALAKSNAAGAVDLIAEALRVPLSPEEREAMIAALERFGATDEKARTLAVVHRGLEAGSDTVRTEAWADRLAAADAPATSPGIASLTAKLDYTHSAIEARPDDPLARLELAESYIALAVDPETQRSLVVDRRFGDRYSHYLFEDALREARAAEEMGASGWRVDAAIGLASYYLGDLAGADERAERAARAVPEGDTSWQAMAVLGLFAEARQRAIQAEMVEGREVPREWISDVHSTYSILAKHPRGSEEQVIAHYDFLVRFRAVQRANEALDAGLAKYPDSAPLHARLRSRILDQSGVDALVETYSTWLAKPDAPANLPWFAGYAAIVAAEFHARAMDPAAARAAYTESLALFDRAIRANEASRESSDHYAALALMGRGRVAMESGDLDAALADVLASLERRPLAANAVDGLGHYGTASARMLGAKLAEAGRAADAARVEAALAALPPEALEPPDFERERPRDDGRGPVRRERRR